MQTITEIAEFAASSLNNAFGRDDEYFFPSNNEASTVTFRMYSDSEEDEEDLPLLPIPSNFNFTINLTQYPERRAQVADLLMEYIRHYTNVGHISEKILEDCRLNATKVSIQKDGSGTFYIIIRTNVNAYKYPNLKYNEGIKEFKKKVLMN
eukprot:GHVP01052862.1.p1 GENE.GHVP01052862.1~~GHVP01052862.1.p1  ORF type:complete len:151 (+),score=22.38 GHVP01052862.1:25-477(+)